MEGLRAIQVIQAFTSQCRHGVHPRCPPGGDVTGQQCHSSKQKRDNCEGSRISGRDFPPLILKSILREAALTTDEFLKLL
ncbi:MAG: hypothetical protein DMG06_18575 [Acidobacteria bacterium]|nr:MAG: hypothetical protein DMG06_18575 [Acidobacteriota bacterium]